ncbi:hypothetical protein Csa_018318 [Cucumis sativus]|uniref:Uncharacterized protein n=1 Tax=Cucumis sativus TaxID=3659 RepID=A0A0A0KFT9_CUCSA|nr:hypothetical protein Csa_018318 [Cucumis sativus]
MAGVRIAGDRRRGSRVEMINVRITGVRVSSIVCVQIIVGGCSHGGSDCGWQLVSGGLDGSCWVVDGWWLGSDLSGGVGVL